MRGGAFSSKGSSVTDEQTKITFKDKKEWEEVVPNPYWSSQNFNTIQSVLWDDDGKGKNVSFKQVSGTYPIQVNNIGFQLAAFKNPPVTEPAPRTSRRTCSRTCSPTCSRTATGSSR